MSRKIILSLAAVATLAGAVLTSNNADAVIRRVGGGGHPIVRPIRPIGYPVGTGIGASTSTATSSAGIARSSCARLVTWCAPSRPASCSPARAPPDQELPDL